MDLSTYESLSKLGTLTILDVIRLFSIADWSYSFSCGTTSDFDHQAIRDEWDQLSVGEKERNIHPASLIMGGLNRNQKTCVSLLNAIKQQANDEVVRDLGLEPKSDVLSFCNMVKDKYDTPYQNIRTILAREAGTEADFLRKILNRYSLLNPIASWCRKVFSEGVHEELDLLLLNFFKLTFWNEIRVNMNSFKLTDVIEKGYADEATLKALDEVDEKAILQCEYPLDFPTLIGLLSLSGKEHAVNDQRIKLMKARFSLKMEDRKKALGSNDETTLTKMRESNILYKYQHAYVSNFYEVSRMRAALLIAIAHCCLQSERVYVSYTTKWAFFSDLIDDFELLSKQSEHGERYYEQVVSGSIYKDFLSTPFLNPSVDAQLFELSASVAPSFAKRESIFDLRCQSKNAGFCTAQALLRLGKTLPYTRVAESRGGLRWKADLSEMRLTKDEICEWFLTEMGCIDEFVAFSKTAILNAKKKRAADEFAEAAKKAGMSHNEYIAYKRALKEAKTNIKREVKDDFYDQN